MDATGFWGFGKLGTIWAIMWVAVMDEMKLDEMESEGRANRKQKI